MTEPGKPAEHGFEFRGEFYRLTFDPGYGKDMMLVDRLTAMSIQAFEAAVQEIDPDNIRGPILLGLIATSIRAKHTDWSVERIVRIVTDLNLADLEFIGDDVADVPSPPADGSEAETPTEPETPNPSTSSSDGSSSSPTPKDTANSETLYAVPA